MKRIIKLLFSHLQDHRGEVDFDKMLSEFPDVMDIKNLQKALGIGRNSAYDLIGSGKIRSIRIGKLVKILKPDIIDFLKSARYNSFDSNGSASEKMKRSTNE